MSRALNGGRWFPGSTALQRHGSWQGQSKGRRSEWSPPFRSGGRLSTAGRVNTESAMVPARMQAFSVCPLPPRRVPLSMPEERKEGGLPVMTSNTGLANLAIRTGSRALGGRPYRKTHDRPGFLGLSPSYGSDPGLGKNALAACGPRRARRVPRHDCAVGTARIRYRMAH